MAITVVVDIQREFTAPCNSSKAFELLADVPRSASHFPKVDQLIDLGDNTYRWEMKKMGFGKVNVQTIYACRYSANDSMKGWAVKWTPIEGVGNTRVTGQWDIRDLDDCQSRITFDTRAEASIPVPALAKRIAAPIVIREFNGLIDGYIENLQKTFQELGKS